MRGFVLLALLAGGCVTATSEQSGLSPAEERALDEAAVNTAADDIENAVAQMDAADEAETLSEAQAFMASYARDLIAGDRAAIAARYHRQGAWRVGNGQKVFESWAAIRDFYAGPNWSPPARFAWRELEYQPLGRDAVVVVGLFDWTAAPGRPPITVSYTGLLLREDGVLRIRLEDESAARQPD